MPELPEVETTRAGIAPHICGKAFVRTHIRQPKLRWPVNPDLAAVLNGQTVMAVSRRAKYLLIHTGAGYLIIHLGMSGSLRIYEPGQHPPPPPCCAFTTRAVSAPFCGLPVHWNTIRCCNTWGRSL